MEIIMSKITFIARCDDLGSSQSANRAIDSVTRAGLFKNVSIMAPGPAVESAAQLLKDRKGICFGMHVTLNAEWDKIKWGPISKLTKDSGLLDENGYFLSDPSLFASTKPTIETVMIEVAAQLEKLHRLGFDIRYIDSHMFPEMFIDGLNDAMQEFVQKKGLIDTMQYYQMPPGFRDYEKIQKNPLTYLRTLPAGQYFFVCHPAFDTPETRMTGNVCYSGEMIAKDRDREARLFGKKTTTLALRCIGITGTRYDEAKPGKRATIDEIKNMLK
jgi:hypothetical protein